ncbi:5-hydroxytryptamine receptor 3E-like [Ambystoma mexicanum]|uniref:5-hydroxytryptamine receptor 3E-like n=1 Tax=Ambystoma mexicanum TaxID=8296 RepID=UPI0037E79195
MSKLLAFLVMYSLAPAVTYSEDCGFYDVIKNLTILTDPLFNNVRPVKDAKQTTVVKLDFTLYAILDLEMKYQTLKTFGWLNITWKNEYLTWDPAQFCGISRITASVDSVWNPDLFVYEMTDEDKSPAVQFLYVSNDGEIDRLEPMMISSTCGIDTYKFPFDIQTCKLTVGSFMHSADEIVINAISNSSEVTERSKDVFRSKGDWSLLRIDVESQNDSYAGSVWSLIVYKIVIQRTPSHYVVNLIIPACFLVLLDLASMFISMDDGERLSFKITIVLGFSVLLLILNDLLPSSQGTPILDVFCMVCLMVMTNSIVVAIFISYLLHQSERRPVPLWVRSFVLKHMARALFVNQKTEDKDEDMTLTKETGLRAPTFTPKEGDSTEAELLRRVLLEMIKLRQLVNSSKGCHTESEWHMVAFVLDRFFSVVYLITVVTMFCVVLLVWSA